MPSYRLIRRILKEVNSQRVSDPIEEDDFVFLSDLFKSSAHAVSELHELERLGYIKFVETGKFIPLYPLFHWKEILFLKILRYVGHSILTPILVTLVTLWLTSLLQSAG